MFLRMVLESLKRQKKKKALVVTAIALGMATVTAQLAVFLDIGDRMSAELKAFGANILVIPKGDNLSIDVGGLDLAAFKSGQFIAERDLVKLKRIFWKNNIIAFAPFLPVTVNVGGQSVTLNGTWFSEALVVDEKEQFVTGADKLFKFWKVDGRYPSSKNEVLVGRRLAEEKGIRIGTDLAFGARVVGILTTGGEEDRELVGPIALAQDLRGTPGAVKKLQVSALTTPESAVYERMGQNPRDLPPEEFERWYCTPFVSSIAFQLAEALPGTEAFPIRQVAETEGKILTKMELLIALISAVALLASALAVMSTMMAAVFERRTEVGLLKALGAGNGRVLGLFLTEAFLLALVGGALGFVLGMLLGEVLAQTVFSMTMEWNVLLLPIAVAGALLITLVGSVLPFGKLLRFEPIQVLRQR